MDGLFPLSPSKSEYSSVASTGKKTCFRSDNLQTLLELVGDGVIESDIRLHRKLSKFHCPPNDVSEYGRIGVKTSFLILAVAELLMMNDEIQKGSGSTSARSVGTKQGCYAGNLV